MGGEAVFMFSDVDVSGAPSNSTLMHQSAQMPETDCFSDVFKSLSEFIVRLGQGFCPADTREPSYPAAFEPLTDITVSDLAMLAAEVSAEASSGPTARLPTAVRAAWRQSQDAIAVGIQQSRSLPELVQLREDMQALESQARTEIQQVRSNGALASEDAQAVCSLQDFLIAQRNHVSARVLPCYEYENLALSESFLALLAQLQVGESTTDLKRQFNALCQAHQRTKDVSHAFPLSDVKKVEIKIQGLAALLVENTRKLAETAIRFGHIKKAYYRGALENPNVAVPKIRARKAEFAKITDMCIKYENQIQDLLKILAVLRGGEPYAQRLEAIADRIIQTRKLADSVWLVADKAVRDIGLRQAVFSSNPFPMGDRVRRELLFLQRELYRCRDALFDAHSMDGHNIDLWRTMTLCVKHNVLELRERAFLDGRETRGLADFFDNFLSDAEELYQKWSAETVREALGVTGEAAQQDALDPELALQTLGHIASRLEQHPERAQQLKKFFTEQCWAMATGLDDYIYLQSLFCQPAISDYDMKHLQHFIGNMSILRAPGPELLNKQYMVQHTKALENLWRNCTVLFSTLPILTKKISDASLNEAQQADIGAWVARLHENEKRLSNQDVRAAEAFTKMLAGVLAAMQEATDLPSKLADQVMQASYNAACTDWATTALLDMQAIIEAEALNRKFVSCLPAGAKKDGATDQEQTQRLVSFVADNRTQFLKLLRFSAFKQFLAEAPTFQRDNQESVEQALYLYALLSEHYGLPGEFDFGDMQYADYTEEAFGLSTLASSLEAARLALSDEVLLSGQSQLLDNLSAFGINLWQELMKALPEDSDRRINLAELNDALDALVDSPNMLSLYKGIIEKKDTLLSQGLCVQQAKADVLAAFGLAQSSQASEEVDAQQQKS